MGPPALAIAPGRVFSYALRMQDQNGNRLPGGIAQPGLVVDPKRETLARQAPELDVPLEALDEIAALAMRITHLQHERAGLPIEPIHARPYHARTSQERAAMRAGVMRTIQAMILLGWLELPQVALPG